MKKRRSPNSLFFFLFFTLLFAPDIFSQNTVSSSTVWYAPLLKSHFPDGIPIHGITYPLVSLPCLPRDIIKFNVTAGKTDIGLGEAFQVTGTLKISEIIAPFSIFDGAQGKRYMLFLQAYLFSSNGILVWQQQGFPARNSWVSASGDSVEFRLINALNKSTSGSTLIIVAAGDPILSDFDETRVILGAYKINL